MGKQILVAHGVITRIKDELGCSIFTVRCALRGFDSTDLQKEIRNVAITKFGGVYIKN